MAVKQAVIMAGGKGLRLRPLTYMLPKPMLPFGDATVIEHTIKRLSQHGIKEIFIVTSYQNHRFKECLSCQEKYKVKICIQEESAELDTIGGLFYLRNKLTTPFVLINGDLITNANFTKLAEYHRQQNARITVCVKDFEYQLPYGLVISDKDRLVQALEEKPIYNFRISLGIYLMEPNILDYLDGKPLKATELLSLLLKDKQKISIYMLKEKWIDMGQVKDYEDALNFAENWEEEDD